MTGKFFGLGFSLLFGAALAEGGGYLALDQAGGQPLAVFERIRSGDSVLTLKPSYTQRWTTDEFDVTVRTNAAGFREDDDFKLGEVGIAAFGDSFTFGHGVEANRRYTAAIGRQFPGQRVASLAYVSGFEPEHYEFYLNRHPELRPRIAIFALYLGNDLESDVRETRIHQAPDGRIDDVVLPYREVFEGQLVNASAYRIAVLPQLARHSYFFRFALSRLNGSQLRDFLFDPEAVVPNMFNSPDTERGRLGELGMRALKSLVRADAIVKERGGRTIVLIVPPNWFVSSEGTLHIRPDLIGGIPTLLRGENVKTAVAVYCRSSHLDCLDPTAALTAQDYFFRDGHWKDSGHAKVGDLLAEHIRAIGSGR